VEYKVTNRSDVSVTIDGLGVLPPGKTHVYTHEAAQAFSDMRGLPLVQANMPEGVEIVVLLGPEEASGRAAVPGDILGLSSSADKDASQGEEVN